MTRPYPPTLLAILVILSSLAFFIPQSHAVGTATTTSSRLSILGQTQRVVLTLTFTGDSGSGAFPTATINPATYGITGWYLLRVETNPGTPAPDAAYDIAITDAAGYDVTEGALADRSATLTESEYIGTAVITDTWTVTLTNNSTASAVVVVTLVFSAN